jgi:hypothetical protein
MVWNAEKDQILVECMLVQYRAGKRGQGGFKPEGWVDGEALFGKEAGVNCGIDSIKSRYYQLQAEWRTALRLKEKSGWGWNEDLCKLDVDDAVWEEELQVSKKLAFWLLWCLSTFVSVDRHLLQSLKKLATLTLARRLGTLRLHGSRGFVHKDSCSSTCVMSSLLGRFPPVAMQ